jgi:glucose-1-phosphate thymidylyltransferase
LGDNIYYGDGISKLLINAVSNAKYKDIATVFGYHVNDPQRYGVVDFDQNGKVLNIEEKPINPKSNYAVTGLYFYPNDVVKKATEILPSDRGELEITDLNNIYLKNDKLFLEKMDRGYTWLDTGTHESLLEAGQFIHTIEKRQGLKVGCLEEIAYEKGFITKDQLLKGAEKMKQTEYGTYLIIKYNDKP